MKLYLSLFLEFLPSFSGNQDPIRPLLVGTGLTGPRIPGSGLGNVRKISPPIMSAPICCRVVAESGRIRAQPRCTTASSAVMDTIGTCSVTTRAWVLYLRLIFRRLLRRGISLYRIRKGIGNFHFVTVRPDHQIDFLRLITLLHSYLVAVTHFIHWFI
jgi:hypothetical protein